MTVKIILCEGRERVWAKEIKWSKFLDVVFSSRPTSLGFPNKYLGFPRGWGKKIV